ncbi:MAG: NfeD family protein [Lentisphaerota bacterium]
MEFWKPEIIWCIIGLIMLFGEFACPGFVILFFGIGAFVVALVTLFVDISINVQIVIFLLSSILSIFLLRKWLKSIFAGFLTGKNSLPKNIDSFVGKTAVAAENIEPNSIGKVEFHGTLWNAVSETPITKGTLVVIKKQNNLTFEVKPQTKGEKQ